MAPLGGGVTFVAIGGTAETRGGGTFVAIGGTAETRGRGIFVAIGGKSRGGIGNGKLPSSG